MCRRVEGGQTPSRGLSAEHQLPEWREYGTLHGAWFLTCMAYSTATWLFLDWEGSFPISWRVPSPTARRLWSCRAACKVRTRNCRGA